MSNAITAFALLAERYCSWVASPALSAAHDEATARELLPELYLAAHRLPEGTPAVPSSPAYPLPEYEHVRSRFRELSVGYYGDTFDPLVVPPEEATVSDLADDLADIHRDLFRGLQVFRAGAHAAAAWQWRYHFVIHWGAHLVGALRALHHAWAQAHPPY